jgi:hypothetical protein
MAFINPFAPTHFIFSQVILLIGIAMLVQKGYDLL